MINRVVLVGRITRDPEVRYTSANVPVVSFTLAVNRAFADQSGERQADFIQCVAWRNQAENLAKFISKGALLGVDGRIQTRTYEAEEGTRYFTEVVADSIQFLEPRGNNQERDTGYQDRSSSYQADNHEDVYQIDQDIEDKNPF